MGRVGADGETGDFKGLMLSNSGPVFLGSRGFFFGQGAGSRPGLSHCKRRIASIIVTTARQRFPHGTSGTNMGTLLPAIAGDTRGLFKLEKKELNFKI